MRVHCYITPQRVEKTRAYMTAFLVGAYGCGRPTDEIMMLPANDRRPADVHVVWGQWMSALEIVPYARRRGEHCLNIDNGWVLSARGGAEGFYRFTFDGPSPRLLPGLNLARAHAMGVQMKPWRRRGRHVLICMPGPNFGRPWGATADEWSKSIISRVAESTDRPIIFRTKTSPRSIEQDLKDAWCVVTYGSNAAVDAVLAGVPVFCAEANAAAPMGRTDLALEDPVYPDREAWLASLVHQQFTLDEISAGLMWRTFTQHFPELRA